jgi:hypothetical protein
MIRPTTPNCTEHPWRSQKHEESDSDACGGSCCIARAQQRRLLEGVSSDPIGPGINSAGLDIFRYETRCGTLWGHTQFMAASTNGTRSVAVSVNERLTPEVGAPGVFPALRTTERRRMRRAKRRSVH